MMPGIQLQEVVETITDAYDANYLTKVLAYRMNVKLGHVVASGPLPQVVFDLVQWADMQGRDSELIRAVAQARPGHAGMQKLYQKYGMAVPVTVQDAGTTDAVAPRAA